jgi:hypothetical protein
LGWQFHRFWWLDQLDQPSSARIHASDPQTDAVRRGKAIPAAPPAQAEIVMHCKISGK